MTFSLSYFKIIEIYKTKLYPSAKKYLIFFPILWFYGATGPTLGVKDINAHEQKRQKFSKGLLCESERDRCRLWPCLYLFICV